MQKIPDQLLNVAKYLKKSPKKEESSDQDQSYPHKDRQNCHRQYYLNVILREIPSLPSQHAVLLGWATELPIMAKMRKLPKSQCPQSNDPDFWDVWTGNKKRDIEWEKIANEWQKKKQYEI